MLATASPSPRGYLLLNKIPRTSNGGFIGGLPRVSALPPKAADIAPIIQLPAHDAVPRRPLAS
jgi:hypothetical protein